MLVVEDDILQQRVHRETLGDEGIAVEAVGSLAEATALLARAKPDAILLDLGLPDSEGVTTLLEVRASTSLPIVVLSGDCDPATERLVLQAGAFDFLVKAEASSRQIARALRHAAECADLKRALDASRAEVQQGRELLDLDRFTYAVVPLRVSHPAEFVDQSNVYSLAISLAVRGDDREMAGKMRSIAEALFGLGARPRDCIELHKEVLLKRLSTSIEYTEHARVCLLDLTCALCALYRQRDLERGETLDAQSAELVSLREEVRELTEQVRIMRDQLFDIGKQRERVTGPLALPTDGDEMP